MADVHNKRTRSFNMSMIKGKDTKPEIIVRNFLFHKGFRYKLNYSKLPGKPDIVLPKYKTAISINGCFWHGHYVFQPKNMTPLELQIDNIKAKTAFNSIPSIVERFIGNLRMPGFF